jgi:hypothetical protein
MTVTIIAKNIDNDPFIPRSLPTPGMNTAGPSAGVSALVNILGFLNTQSLQWAIRDAVATLKPSLDASIQWWANNGADKCYDPSLVGCVVETVIWDSPGPISQPDTYGLTGVYAGNCGLDYASALQGTLSSGGIYPGAPDGATAKFFYTWYMQE